MGKNIFKIGRDGIPDEKAKLLYKHIEKEFYSLAIPKEWNIKKIYKEKGSGKMSDGFVAFQPGSWLIQLSIDDLACEPFYISGPEHLYKIRIGKSEIQKKLDSRL